MTFLNKTCVVVGGSGGIGQALVRELHARGAHVISVGHAHRLSQARKTLSVDLRHPATIRKLAVTLRKSTGKIDYLFNASGVAAYVPFLKMSRADLETVIHVNLTGAIYLTQACLPLMRRSGCVVNVGSLAGIARGHKHFAVYAASKQGLVGFSRAMSAEFPKLRFIVAIPAGVNTNIARQAIGAKQLKKKFERSYLDQPSAVATGILEQLALRRIDVCLYPTPKSLGRAYHV